MIIKVIQSGGIGRIKPLVIQASQVIVYYDDGTPVACAAEYGPTDTLAVSMAGQKDFFRMLSNLGERTTIIVDTLQMPAPPQGARLIAGPKEKE